MDPNRGAVNWVEEKLNRALATDEWHRIFNEDAPPSDHKAILLVMNSAVTQKKRRFRFKNA